MDLFALILVCAVSGDAPAATLTHQIAQSIEVDVSYVDDLSAETGYSAPSFEVASGLIQTLLVEGHHIRVGLGQIPGHIAYDEFGMSPEQMLDPCTNIGIASELLSRALKIYSDSSKALSFYLTGDASSEQGLTWARYVLSHEPVDLDQEAFKADGFKPSRRFEVEKPIFVSESGRLGKKSLHTSAKLFVTSEEKPQFKSLSLDEPAAKPPKERDEQWRVKSRATSLYGFEAQPPVTDERLPTSNELQEKR